MLLNIALIILTGAVIISFVMGINWLVRTLWKKIDSALRDKVAYGAAVTAMFACATIMAGFICYGVGFIFLAISAAVGINFPIHLN